MIEEDVARQTEREKQLQQRFQDLRRRLQVLKTTDAEDDA